jgi:uncharacterized zinc-type alcohol dehydrogenase-like protein
MINAYFKLLRRDGVLTMGVPPKAWRFTPPSHLKAKKTCRLEYRRHPRTQEMLDFCGAHNITADVEVIPIQKVNEAYERTIKGDVRYRFVIDMKTL